MRLKYFSVFFVITMLGAKSAAETITPEMRKEDPRLKTQVTVTIDRASIGDVLSKVSEKTGVALSASDKDSAADPAIHVHLRSVPLVEALDALWSLVSYKGARWHWVREGEPGQFRYVLTRPLAARNLPSQLRDGVQALFEEEAERAKRYLRMSNRELEAHGSKDRQAKAILDSPVHRAGLVAFFSCVTPDTQTGILRGQIRHHRVNLSDMPDDARSAILELTAKSKGYRILPDGTIEPIPPPQYVLFDAGRQMLRSDVAPSLGMQIEAYGGGGHIGGRFLEERTAEDLYLRWLLPGDSRTIALEQKQVEISGSAGGGQVDETLRAGLAAVVDSAQVSVLARLPELGGSSTWNPLAEPQKTFGGYLGRFSGFPGYLQRKWRSGLLLITHAGWPQMELRQPPRWLVERLRAAESADGVLPIQELVHAAGILSTDQLRTLGRDFPVMNNVAGHHGILRHLHERQLLTQAMSESGLLLNPGLSAAVLSDQYGGLAKFVTDGSAKAVRIVVKTDSEERAVTFGVILQDGRWRPVQGFRLRPRKVAPTSPSPNL